MPTITAKHTIPSPVPTDDEDSCKGSGIYDCGEEETDEEEGTGEEEGMDLGDGESTGAWVSRILHLIHYYN